MYNKDVSSSKYKRFPVSKLHTTAIKQASTIQEEIHFHIALKLNWKSLIRRYKSHVTLIYRYFFAAAPSILMSLLNIMKWNWLFVSGCLWLAPLSTGKGRWNSVPSLDKFINVLGGLFWNIIVVPWDKRAALNVDGLYLICMSWLQLVTEHLFCNKYLLYSNLLICLLTPWSTVLLERLTGSQLVKKFPTFYGTRRFLRHSQVLATCA